MQSDPFLTPAPGKTSTRPGRPYREEKRIELRKAASSGYVALPIILFVAVSGTFTFLWQIRWVPLVLCLFLFVTFLHQALPSQSALASQTSTAGRWIPFVSLVLAMGFGSITGLYAHEAYMASFYAIALGESYDDVLASAPGAAYADAGRIEFAESSQIDSSRTLGYMHMRNYCVAPVIDSGDSQGKRVGFWAVGIDCCGAREDFECGKSDDSHARGGVRLAPDGIFEKTQEFYMRAVRQAALVYDLDIDEEPVFVHWVKDTAAEQAAYFFKAVGVLLLGLLVFVILMVSSSVARAVLNSTPVSEGDDQLPQ